MNDVTRCPEPETLVVLLYDDEGDTSERAALQDHLSRCPMCAGTLTGLETARGTLGAWPAPRLPLGFALVRTAPLSWPRRALWSGGLAAAAVLVLAAAASLAQLEVRYDQTGFSVRTGSGASPSDSGGVVTRSVAASASSTGAGAATAPAAPTSRRVTPEPAWITRAAAGQPPWRADLDLLATQLRTELSRPAPPVVTVAAGRSTSDEQLLRRVAELLDQSEIRQQQNLALRVTELGRQFEIQRQADIVQVEQSLNRIEQQRRDLLRRVTATQMPQP